MIKQEASGALTMMGLVPTFWPNQVNQVGHLAQGDLPPGHHLSNCIHRLWVVT
jgi:hypothetical protein